MALTELEKIKMLRAMGWPPKTIDATSTVYSKITADRLANLSDAILSEARRYLAKIEKVEDRLDSALTRAGVKSIDDIELDGTEMDILRRERLKLIRELGIILDIPIMAQGGSPTQGCVIA